jgi:hypothetical protein
MRSTRSGWRRFLPGKTGIDRGGGVEPKELFSPEDSVEGLPAGMKGFWIKSPAGIIHLVSEE